MSASTLYNRCQRIGITLVRHGDGWYWSKGSDTFGPYPTKKQAALCALQSINKD